VIGPADVEDRGGRLDLRSADLARDKRYAGICCRGGVVSGERGEVVLRTGVVSIYPDCSGETMTGRWKLVRSCSNLAFISSLGPSLYVFGTSAVDNAAQVVEGKSCVYAQSQIQK
jgi:hypothetical protein